MNSVGSMEVYGYNLINYSIKTFDFQGQTAKIGNHPQGKA